ncbi:hypothetical protein FCM35_KLT09021 [Carex littledalei]|uniref:Uncharacterized protein n=1 Tax=Carex littledalei TaxID=544730 RepID=A0A833QW50_9POAL|nr:hypothetical protein FCM35_KLT09021 [Carex littledalei]
MLLGNNKFLLHVTCSLSILIDKTSVLSTKSQDPRPHISLVWGSGDIRYNLKQAVVQIDRSHNSAGLSQGNNFKCKFSNIVPGVMEARFLSTI